VSSRWDFFLRLSSFHRSLQTRQGGAVQLADKVNALKSGAQELLKLTANFSSSRRHVNCKSKIMRPPMAAKQKKL
jgi:X-X-X-Leu-X-X-Gly heptad repeat protein